MAKCGWSVLGLVLALVLAACQDKPVPEVGTNCGGNGETAVSLILRNENDSPMQHVDVRYRVDDGAWQTLPERANGEALVPGAAGNYEIVAQKQGYETVETAVSVLPAADGCGFTPQRLTLAFAREACPVTPQPLALSLAAPIDLLGVQVWGRSPAQGRQELVCTADATGSCVYLLPLTEAGTYELTVAGLPGNGRMSLVDDAVAYTYTPFDLRLVQGMREQHVTGEGANEAMISVLVRPDEINCPLAALDELTIVLTPDRREEGEQVAVDLLGSLMITDLDADGCQVEAQLMPIYYNVTVPAGTRLANVAMLYWLGEDWQTADCQFQESQFLCTAMLPNPLLGQPYAVKAVVNGEEFGGTQLPFDNLCYLFNDDVD